MFHLRNSIRQIISRSPSPFLGQYSIQDGLRVSCFRPFSSKKHEEKFKKAVDKVPKLKSEPGNDVKLKLYALYKQSTIGQCNVPKPGMFDMVAKYKWEAWSNLGDKSQEDAMEEYITVVEELIETIGLQEDAAANTSKSQHNQGTNESASKADIVMENKKGVLTIRLNRPTKMNALTTPMYHQITKSLNAASQDDNVKLVVLTGTGDWFCSGNDLSAFAASLSDPVKAAKDGAATLENFVNSFIDFPKPIIAVVNGPALGIMVTTLALCDTVICSDTATFQTPFLSTSQTPEGCSTYLFPKIMGLAKANAMLLFNEKINALQAYQCGFVSRVVPKDELDRFVESWIYGDKGLLSFGSTITWRTGKKIIRNEEEKAILKKVNKVECEKLAETWLSPDFAQAMSRFFSRKKSS